MVASHLYVHIPWCLSKCPYCDFFSATAPELPDPDRYVDALFRDLDRANGDFETIYVGGGTPTELPFDSLERLVERLAARLRPGGEWSIETNPASLDERKAALFARVGVTRLSIGFQSASDTVLARLGRAHRHADNIAAVRLARSFGFAGRSGDMIFGLPEDALDETIDFLLGAELTHVSAYELTIEGESAWNRARFDPSEEDEVKLERFTRLVERLDAAGLHRYEISNFARSGAACRSHLNVWRSGDFVGIGAGAHGHEDGIRYARPRDVMRYLEDAPSEREAVEDLFAETIQLGTRLVRGFDLGEIPASRREALERGRQRLHALEAEGYVSLKGRRVVPTARGLRFHNDLALLAAG